MSQRQRFTFLAIAIVIAVVAIVVLADSSEDDNEPGQTAATATATPTATSESPGEESTPTPTPTPKPPPLVTAGKVAKLAFTEGETIRFRVRAAEPEEIHVHCYDITRQVPPGRTITLSFKASIPGTCGVEFHNSGETIAELKVEPE